jgi:hypothetical protein
MRRPDPAAHLSLHLEIHLIDLDRGKFLDVFHVGFVHPDAVWQPGQHTASMTSYVNLASGFVGSVA